MQNSENTTIKDLVSIGLTYDGQAGSTACIDKIDAE